MDRLGHDPREVDAVTLGRQVVADEPPARPDALDDVGDRALDDGAEPVRRGAGLVRVARQEEVGRDRLGHGLRARAHRGDQVTTPTSLVPRPAIVQPSPSAIASSRAPPRSAPPSVRSGRSRAAVGRSPRARRATRTGEARPRCAGPQDADRAPRATRGRRAVRGARRASRRGRAARTGRPRRPGRAP